MKQHIAALLAASLAANSALLAAVAEDLGGGDSPDNAPDTPAAGESGGRGRGRPRGGAKSEAAAPKGMDYDALADLIAPLVEAGKGEKVKKIIARHAPGGGGLEELATLPQNQAAFEKDLKALEF